MFSSSREQMLSTEHAIAHQDRIQLDSKVEVGNRCQIFNGLTFFPAWRRARLSFVRQTFLATLWRKTDCGQLLKNILANSLKKKLLWSPCIKSKISQKLHFSIFL